MLPITRISPWMWTRRQKAITTQLLRQHALADTKSSWNYYYLEEPIQVTRVTYSCFTNTGNLLFGHKFVNFSFFIEHRDKKGFTPLILAATAGHEKVVDLLLNHNADIEAQSERTKDTPLSLACSGGRYEVLDRYDKTVSRLTSYWLTQNIFRFRWQTYYWDGVPIKNTVMYPIIPL